MLNPHTHDPSCRPGGEMVTCTWCEEVMHHPRHEVCLRCQMKFDRINREAYQQWNTERKKEWDKTTHLTLRI